MSITRNYFAFCIFLTWIFAINLAFAGGVITSSSDPWEPFVDPKDPNYGIAIAITTAAFATQGYEQKHQFNPWKRSMHDVTNSKIDILANTWITEERKKFLKYSDPYVANSIKFIKLKSNPFTYSGIESIAGLKVGTMLGYGYPEIFITSEAIQDPANDFTFVVKKLLAGRIDLAIEDEIVAKYKINLINPDYLDEIEFLDPPLSENTLHVTCALANPRCEEIINAFNTGLAKIKESGEYDKILAEYGIK